MATAVLGTKLDPTGSVSIDAGVNLDTNGLTGDATPFVRRQIGPPLLSHDFLAALNAAGVAAQSIVHLTNVQDTVATPPNPTWTTRSDKPAMELTVAGPGPGRGQFVLQTGESGVVTWHFAKPAGAAGNDTRRYLLVRKPPPTPGANTQTAPPAPPQLVLPGALGAQTIHVLSFPWNPLAAIAHQVVSGWESRNSPLSRTELYTPELSDRFRSGFQ